MNQPLRTSSRERRLQLIINSAMDAFIMIDVNNLVVEWSDQAAHLFGWGYDEVIGQSLSDLIIPYRHLSAHNHAIAHFQKTGAHRVLNRRIEITAWHKLGHEIPIEVTVNPIELDGETFFCASIRDITERRQAEKALADSRNQLELALEANQSILDHSLDVIGLFDETGHILQVSNACEAVWGYKREELLGRSLMELLHPDDRESTLQAIADLNQGKAAINFENRYVHKDGRLVYMLWNTNWSPKTRQMIGVGRDVTALKEVAARLEDSEQRYKSLFEHHPDAVFSFDLDGRFVSANRAVTRLTGYPAQELLNMHFLPLLAPECVDEAKIRFNQAATGIPQNYEVTCLHKNGSRLDVSATKLPIIVNGEIVGIYGIARDITERKQNERRIEYLATHDSLTGLPNRNLLEDRMRHAIEQAHRGRQQLAVLFLDLNRFKMINDSFGHDRGDMLLRVMAARLKKAVRAGDTLARLGGDEFVIVLENIAAIEEASAFAESILNAVDKPVLIEGHEISVSTSIGISMYPKDGADAHLLIKNADLAMYQAKDLGVGVFRFYDPVMNARVMERLLTENALRRAIERDELVLHYQPRVDIKTSKIVGMEALVRWQHPEKGLLPPGDFIALAEEAGLIDTVGAFVLLQACRQNKRWQEMGLPGLKVAVNLSAHQLRTRNIIASIQSALAESGLDAQWLELEITESLLMQNMDQTIEILRDLRQLDLSFSIDDFGTGYSSLSYLKRLPIDAIKIDKSFIRDLADDVDDRAIVAAAIAMAHSMGLRVVAEGVTIPEHVQILAAHQCDEMQGYLLSRPLPADEMAAFLKSAGDQH